MAKAYIIPRCFKLSMPCVHYEPSVLEHGMCCLSLPLRAKQASVAEAGIVCNEEITTPWFFFSSSKDRESEKEYYRVEKRLNNGIKMP